MTTADELRNDPLKMLAHTPMRGRQIVAIGTCVLLNAIDGFDVLSISFAAPGIARDWGIDPAALGIVLSMELIGMAFGAILLGQVADAIGRRPTAVACLFLMIVGMMGTSLTASVGILALTRLVTGIGIGGMLAVTNALVAEYASDKWRAAAVSIMAAGYPFGGIAGGAIASALLANGSWRDLFWLGAAMTALCFPLVLILLPESIGTLLRKRRSDTLARVNRSLRMLGHPPAAGLPPLESETPRAPIARLFAEGMAPVTIFLTAAFFLHIMTFYFILKWIPKIVVDLGFSPSSAGSVLAWANVGGLTGALLFGAMSLRIPLRALLIAFMIASSAMLVLFGQGPASLSGLSGAAAASGFFTNAGVVGLYALVASSFPTAIRGGGTGFVIGIGRAGAALSPILGGFLFQVGLDLATVAGIMACGSGIAAGALMLLPRVRRNGT